MRFKKDMRNLIFCLLAGISFIWLGSCSEELVIIEEIERKELDSLDNLILVTTDDITAAKIAKDALQRRADSLAKVLEQEKLTINNFTGLVYTVQVVDGSKSYIKGRTSVVTNATVTISQGNTSTQVATNETGMATFPEMKPGVISVTVELDNFADVYMIVDLGTGVNVNASTQVMVFPTSGSDMFTLSGVAYYDQNTTNLHTNTQNDPDHPFTGSSIFETVPAGSNFSIVCAPASIPLNHTNAGKVLQVVYSGLERVATVGANGAFSVTLPVALLTTGASFFAYNGPRTVATLTGVQQNNGSTNNKLWYPSQFYPTKLSDMNFYPGGRGFTDVYYFPN